MQICTKHAYPCIPSQNLYLCIAFRKNGNSTHCGTRILFDRAMQMVYNKEKFILYPNPDFKPITDTLDDGTVVALDLESKIWATDDDRLFKLSDLGDWVPVPIYCYPDFVRKSNTHSTYPVIDYRNHRGTPYHPHNIVARAWLGATPKGYEVDHINGDRQDCTLANIRLVPIWLNHRDGGYLTKLRNQGIDPTYYANKFLLRFFERMTEFKATHSRYVYVNLDRTALLKLLVTPEFTVGNPHARMEYDMTHHMEI